MTVSEEQTSESEIFAELARLSVMTAKDKLLELAAAGRRLSPEWTIVGVPFLVVDNVECGVCIRQKVE